MGKQLGKWGRSCTRDERNRERVLRVEDRGCDVQESALGFGLVVYTTGDMLADSVKCFTVCQAISHSFLLNPQQTCEFRLSAVNHMGLEF